MRTSNVQEVRKAIKHSPLTVPQIRQRTGLSYNTVSRALVELDAQKVPGTYPTEWIMAQPKATPDKRDNFLLVKNRNFDLQNDWDKARGTLAAQVAHFEITPQSDIDKLVSVAESLASAFAQMAVELTQAKQHPDWFDQFMGEVTENETPFG